MQSKALPQRIWFLWFQGKDNLPEVVKMCLESWEQHNPNWEITFLDNNNLQEFLDFKSDLGLKKDSIPLQAQSDIIRINILNKHGGVWVDSTCYCTKPLDTWLTQNLESGFFAFSKPNKDRMISSWFIAAIPNNKLVNIYCEATNSFWQNSPPLKLIKEKEEQTFKENLLLKTLSLKPALWHSSFIKTNTSLSHYFWFHYLFEHLYQSNSVFKNTWDLTPKISANIPHQLMHFGFNKLADDTIKEELNNPMAPLYKLNWKRPYKKGLDTTFRLLEKKHSLEGQ